VPVADNPGVVACLVRPLFDGPAQAGRATQAGGAGNTGALHLYQSLGFTEYGRLKDFVAIGSHRYDMVLCALDLREHRGVTPG